MRDFLRRSQSSFGLEALENRILLTGNTLFRLRTGALSVGREELSGVGVGDYAIFAGGDISPSQVDLLNVTTGQWSQHSLSQGRPFAAAVRVGDLAIFAGGGSVPSFSDSSAVDIFDADNGQWSTAYLSAPRGYIAAASVGKLALFAGGIHITGSFPSPITTPTNIVDIYNSSTNQWSTAHLSSARWNVAGATVGDLALFAGGNSSDGPSNVVDVYNGVTGIWSTMTMPVAAIFSAVTTVGTKVIFGTDSIGGPDQMYEMYDAVTGRWSTGHLNDVWGATAVGDKALFAEHMFNLAAGSQVVDVYDLATGLWSRASLSNTRYEVSAASAGRFAFFAGGLSDAGATSSNVVDSLQDLDPSAVLSGSVQGRSGGNATVFIENMGDANLGSPYTVQVYAYPPGSRHGGILLGSAVINTPLAVGGSTELSVSISVPAGSPRGPYHLVGVVKAANGTLTPFAGAIQDFTIKSFAKTKAVASKPAPAVVKPAFSTTPITTLSPTDAWLTDAADILD